MLFIGNSNVYARALFQRFHDLEDTASANSDEEKTATRTTQEDAYADNSPGLKLGDSGAPEEDERDHQTDVLEEVGSMHQQSFEKGDKNYVQSKDEIEMKVRVKPKRVWIRMSFTPKQCKNNVCNSATVCRYTAWF